MNLFDFFCSRQVVLSVLKCSWFGYSSLQILHIYNVNQGHLNLPMFTIYDHYYIFQCLT